MRHVRQWFVLIWILFLPSLFLYSRPAFGQEIAMADQQETIEAPDVVVSATKTEIPARHVTSAVEVITGEDLQQRHVRTVSEALRWAQGLSINQSGGAGTVANVRMRGGTPEQTLVLIDGAIVNSATGGGYDFANLTSDNIERIEILRGSQSMLWGSDAMGGVINITTKRGRDKPNVSAFAEYGSFNTIREGGSLAGKKGPIDFSGSITRLDTAGFSAINYRRGAAERDRHHNWQGSVRLGADLPRDGRLEFSFRWLEGIVNFDGFAFNPVTFASDPADVLGARSKSSQYIFAGNYTQPMTDWWSQKLTLSRATENLTSDGGVVERNLLTGATGLIGFPFRSQIETANNRIEWQHNIQVGKPLLLMVGYQYREQKGSNTDLLTQTATFTDKILSSHAGFGEAQLNLWDRVFGTAGIRQDDYNVAGSATTYRVTGGYLHRETGTKLRGSYSTGFRAPTINELFFPGFGNPNLQPEKSQALEAAIEQTLPNDWGSIGVGYFWTRYRNLILSAFDPTECTAPGSFGFCAQNVGLARSEGVEVSTKLKLLRDRQWAKSLDLQIQYTYAATRDISNGPDTRLPRWPLHQISTIISYQPIEGLRGNLEGRYVGERFGNVGNSFATPSFVVWNLSASYDMTKQVQAYLRLDNIFNEKYEEILFFGTPIRSIFGGVRINYDLPL
ncbi:MAG: TonB-dependent receptor [Nitrospira sp.]|jgi:vitamin B12 transporter|nr:TonB-dependent receptor [Nitrospira sp.]MDH4244265.1 TonB-dependent receptor [Nitrospira sp.]MDH4355601.1 TonB-dependent receptor [Nitrospira sp.]MDH5318093.1 TonB-dependent receptor [Nitrospira sp.]